mmetsp:Transcript_32826/g.65872  ORF Transcript_32826/g.65872 Transcript_32826/m.65872 type:complete len:231 (-) Transcript_32826:327-1019(-)
MSDEDSTSKLRIDLATALERCSGDLDLLSQVVSETLDKARDEQVPKMRTALEAGDAKEVHFHAHSIKGASATTGFDCLSKAAKDLDDLVRQGNVDGALPLLESMVVELDSCREYWKRHEECMASGLERCGDDKELFMQIAKEMAADIMPSQLESIEEAVAGGDPANVSQFAMQLLEAAETIGGAALCEAVKPLQAAADKGDLSGAQAMLDEIKLENEHMAAFWATVEDDE